MSDRCLNHNDYTVGWICPLEVEQIAAVQMLDKHHPDLQQPTTDHNTYMLGSICHHNIVIAGLPMRGNCTAATVVAYMKSTFPCLRFILLVGIGGAVPVRTDAGHIRLGHVVVSSPSGQHSGVVQYDHGKAEVGKFLRTGSLSPPPWVLLNAARKLEVKRTIAGKDPLQEHLQRVNTLLPRFRRYKRCNQEEDHLYEASYTHRDESLSCEECGCDPQERVIRVDNDMKYDAQWVTVHRGTIASGEMIIKNGELRDILAKDCSVLCFENEAAGALSNFGCLVIRGISDYADSHKNDMWQGYAAAVAAAYARELFFNMPLAEVAECQVLTSEFKQLIEGVQVVVDNTKITRWLMPSDFIIDYHQARNLYRPGTGKWFLHGERYANWKMKLTRSLWLHGIPGCGKTILSSSVIEDLQLMPSIYPIVLYFFFNFSDSSKNTLDKMLRSLIFQLYRREKRSQKYLDGLVSSKNDSPHLAAILEKATEAVSGIYVVLDGLDECTTKKELLVWLSSSAVQRFHLLVTSREEQDIKSSLSRWMAMEDIIPIQTTLVNEDIRSFVRNELEYDGDFERWKNRPKLRATIEHRLMEKAEGMFRLVVCLLDNLRDCLDSLSLEKTLKTLPTTLERTYDQILLRIPPINRPSAIRILQFLCYSKRPLQLEEAVDIIAVRPDNRPTFSAKYRMLEVRELARYCGSLTRVVNFGVPWSESNSNTELQLAHLSVREYLLSTRVEPTFKHEFQQTPAMGCIVEVSLAYLYQAWQQQLNKGINTQLPFKNLAAQQWWHCGLVIERERHAASKWIRRLFASQDFFEYWLQHHDPDNSPSWPSPAHNMPSVLYYAALGGLTITSIDLLERNMDVNAVAGRYRNALNAATIGGHVEIVKQLLVKGADQNLGQSSHDNALYNASMQNDIEIVRLLLGKNSNDNTKSRYYSIALRGASACGHTQVVNLLLDSRADASTAIKCRNSALHAASRGGHSAIVNILLQKGANVDAISHEYTTPLYTASRKGRLAVVKLLLKWSADVNAIGGDHGTALYAALARNHVRVVKLLLTSGANISLEAGKYSHALHAIPKQDRADTLKLLLKEGTNVDIPGLDGSTRLRCASVHGELKVARLLLQHGASLNTSDHSGSTPLAAAAEHGHLKIVQLLLQHGADPNIPDIYGWTPIMMASDGGHLKIVQILHQYGADIRISSKDRTTPIQTTAHGGHLHVLRWLFKQFDCDKAILDQHSISLTRVTQEGDEQMVRFLLQKGAEVNSIDERGTTPLIAAADKGNLILTRILLLYGADTNVLNKSGIGALTAASEGGYLEVSRLLLKCGADVNMSNNDGLTPLDAASRAGHLEVTQLLLSHGAHIQCAKPDGSSLLHHASHNGDLQLTQLLLQNGAEVDKSNSAEMTPLYLASLKGHIEIARLLLKYGASPNPSSAPDVPILFAAVCSGEADIMHLLIEHGADLSERDADGYTLLYSACLVGRTNLVRLLLYKGVAIDADEPKDTPLLAAVRGGFLDIVKILLKDNSEECDSKDRCKESIEATMFAQTQRLEWFESQKDQSIFHHAASSGSVSMLNYLLNNKSVPNNQIQWDIRLFYCANMSRSANMMQRINELFRSDIFKARLSLTWSFLNELIAMALETFTYTLGQ